MRNGCDWKQGLAWSKEYETGNENIDSQHKQLFKLTSDLIESCQKNDKKITIEETLYFLIGYTATHFYDEEKLAKKYKYPKQKEHAQMHAEFTQTVGGFVDQYKENGDSEALFSAVNKVIVRWLVNHIKGEDSKIAKHIKLSIQNL